MPVIPTPSMVRRTNLSVTDSTECFFTVCDRNNLKDQPSSAQGRYKPVDMLT